MLCYKSSFFLFQHSPKIVLVSLSTCGLMGCPRIFHWCHSAQFCCFSYQNSFFSYLPINFGLVSSRTRKAMVGITKVKLNENEASASKPWLDGFQWNTSSPTSFFFAKNVSIRNRSISKLLSLPFPHLWKYVYKWVIPHNGKLTGLKPKYLCCILTLLIKFCVTLGEIPFYLFIKLDQDK